MGVTTRDVERAVRDRYSRAAGERTEELCCPVHYNPRHLEVIPAEIIDRDYGCGDPSRHLRAGETVLDLGSGTGKICYIASQIVGREGRVLGVDMNDDMLALAESYRASIAEAIGFDNVTFHKARIQDLALDRRALDAHLAQHPVRNADELEELRIWEERQRSGHPLIADGSIDVIVSNCVLNLVRPEDKRRLFHEMFRVLRDTGRVVISDIVSDEDVPAALRKDGRLWSGCLSGAFREDAFLDAFAEAGFQDMRTVARNDVPWQVVDGIEFRSMTVEAFRRKQGPEAGPLEADYAVTRSSTSSCCGPEGD